MEWTATRCKWTHWHGLSSRSDLGSVDVRSSSPSLPPWSLVWEKSAQSKRALGMVQPLQGHRGGCVHNDESVSVSAYLLSAAPRLPSAQMTNALLVNYANLCCGLWVSCTQLAQDAACHSTSWIPPTSSLVSSIYPSVRRSSYLFPSTYPCVFPSPIHPLTHISFFIYSIFLSTRVSASLSIVHPSIHLLLFCHLYFCIMYLLPMFLSPIYLSVSHLSIFICLSINLSNNLSDESTRVCVLIHRGMHTTLLSLITSFIWERKMKIKERFVLLFSPVSDLESGDWRGWPGECTWPLHPLLLFRLDVTLLLDGGVTGWVMASSLCLFPVISQRWPLSLSVTEPHALGHRTALLGGWGKSQARCPSLSARVLTANLLK